MSTVQLRFYEALNDFLPASKRNTTLTLGLDRRTSIKDLIESVGVPHPEIEAIFVNGTSVDFSYIVHPGDRINVYPLFENLNIHPLVRLREHPLHDPRFVADANLGQLARYLRLLGFDVIYRNDFTDRDVAQLASLEHRVVLTRDRALLRHKIITHGTFVRSDNPREQVLEVLDRLQLRDELHPFTRCIRCNGELEDVDKALVLDRLERRTRQHYEHFRRCKGCGQAYWRGSHFHRMEQLCEHFLRGAPGITERTLP